MTGPYNNINSLNLNRRQKKGKKLNYKPHVILMQNKIVFVFANYLDDVLVWNYAMSGFNSLTAMDGRDHPLLN
jgi:hypothetical protein